MNSHNSTYFENSRRATLAQVQYAVLNPGGFAGYSSTVWGLTACDGPNGYAVHGIPPSGSDDGTIAPTAAGGSIVFTPEYSLPTLRAFYSRFRPRIWTAYGFRDAFKIIGMPRLAGISQSKTRPICSRGPPRWGSSKPPTPEPSIGLAPGRLSPCPLPQPRLSDSIACSS
jgi:hypothetical protein